MEEKNNLEPLKGKSEIYIKKIGSASASSSDNDHDYPVLDSKSNLVPSNKKKIISSALYIEQVQDKDNGSINISHSKNISKNGKQNSISISRLHSSSMNNSRSENNEIISQNNKNPSLVRDSSDSRNSKNSNALPLISEADGNTNKSNNFNTYNQNPKTKESVTGPIHSLKDSNSRGKNDNISNIFVKPSDRRKGQVVKKKHLEKKDLYNREKSKLACLIRKKYTALMKESIKLKGTKERYVCCASFRKVTSKVIYQLTGTVVQSIISVFAIIIYIVSTYYPDYSEIDTMKDEYERTVVSAMKWSELSIAIVVNIDFFIALYNSKQRWKYICNFLNMLDIIIVFSIYLNFIVPNIKSLAFIRIFRVIRIMRVFRFYKIIESRKKDSTDDSKNEISRRLISAILTVLAVVFLATGVVHFLNDNFPEYFRIVIPSMDKMACQSGANFTTVDMDPTREGMSIKLTCPEGDSLIKQRGKLTFDLAFYYMVITMATVGYGDIYPDTSWMRLVIGIFVIISIITITKQTSELNDLIKLNSEYQVAYRQTKGHKHCVLSGFFTKTSLIKFLNEFYHIDHKDNSENTKIVIIQSDYPDKEIQSIMMNPKFEENLHYIIGDIFSEHTLQMAHVQTASGIFLISDQNHPDAMKNDQFLILACKAISQYSQSPLYVQFNFSQSLLHDWADWDMASSSQQIKMSIIVKNGFISGFSTMIMNLSSSSSSFYNSNIKETPWMLEYIYGASQEIYIVKIPEDYNREINFTKFAKKSYLNYGSLVIGVKKKVYYQEDKDIFYYIYLLNPSDYELNSEDEVIVISADMDSAKNIFSINKKLKIKAVNEEEFAADNIHLFTETHQQFLQLFRDENEGIKQNYKIDEENEKNEEKKLNSNPRNSLNYMNFQHNNERTKISDIFHKRQHFKIWENNPDEFNRELKNHFLIFCKEEHLWEFMNCFDQYHSEMIFFVSDQHPSSKWDILKRYFKNLVYIECSYSDQEDLVKLNLEKARHVFILTYAVENSNVSDSGILPLVKIIEENYPNCNYTLELSDELNVRYLNNKGLDQEGRGYQSNDDDSKSIKSNSKRKNKSNKKATRLPVRLWPKYAKSDIFFASSLESLLAFSYHNEGVLDVLTKILGFNNYIIRDKNVEENDVLSMYRYIGQNKLLYEKVVNHFLILEPPVIPIAVYRMNTDKELKNLSPFIITNPKKDLELNQFDKVICIGKPKNKKTFIPFKQEDFQEADSDLSHSSLSDNGFGILENSERKKSPQHIYSHGKNTGNEDLDILDEDQLLEKLKIEIKNLKILAKGGNPNELAKDWNNTINENNVKDFMKKEEINVIDEEEENMNLSQIRSSIKLNDTERDKNVEQINIDSNLVTQISKNLNFQDHEKNDKPKKSEKAYSVFNINNIVGSEQEDINLVDSSSHSKYSKTNNKTSKIPKKSSLKQPSVSIPKEGLSILKKIEQQAGVGIEIAQQSAANKNEVINNKSVSLSDKKQVERNDSIKFSHQSKSIKDQIPYKSESDSNSDEKSLDESMQSKQSRLSKQSSKKKKKSPAKKIINNNNYSIKISANNQFQGTNTINISQPLTFSKLSIAAVEGFNIGKSE